MSKLLNSRGSCPDHKETNISPYQHFRILLVNLLFWSLFLHLKTRRNKLRYIVQQMVVNNL